MRSIATAQPVVIFSVYRQGADNLTNHRHVRQTLKRQGIRFKEVLGMYKGTYEVSFIVPKTHLERAEAIAEQYKQETILILDSCRNAKLRTLADSTECGIGQMDAGHVNSDAWTYTNGTFYVCK